MRGVLLFAHNTPDVDYVRMAVATAKRVNHFLNLPVTLVTDSYNGSYLFDNVIIAKHDAVNEKSRRIWFNKGRYRAFDLSPYDETILLDIDYIINSNKLAKMFDIYDDFACHNIVNFLMYPDDGQEKMNIYGLTTLWATVVFFKKTDRCQQIFECMKMVQDNFEHYSMIYNFIGGMFRNDYALTVALRIVNGGLDIKKDYIPWSLVHIGNDTIVSKIDNTSYVVTREHPNDSINKKEFINVTDMDFHVLDKKNCIELLDG